VLLVVIVTIILYILELESTSLWSVLFGKHHQHTKIQKHWYNIDINLLRIVTLINFRLV